MRNSSRTWFRRSVESGRPCWVVKWRLKFADQLRVSQVDGVGNRLECPSARCPSRGLGIEWGVFEGGWKFVKIKNCFNGLCSKFEKFKVCFSQSKLETLLKNINFSKIYLKQYVVKFWAQKFNFGDFQVHRVLMCVEIVEGELQCPDTGRIFPIRDGIPNMLVQEEEVRIFFLNSNFWKFEK